MAGRRHPLCARLRGRGEVRRRRCAGCGRHGGRRRAFAPAGESAGGRADGSDLREPGRPRRQSRSPARGEGHPRHLRPHGDGRRGNRRPHRRRPYLRQDAWCRPRRQRGGRTGSGRTGTAGPGLAQQVRQRQGRRHHHLGHRGHLDADAHAVEQQVLREPVRVRMGAGEVACRRPPMGRQERAGGRAARARPHPQAAPQDADHRPVAALRSDLRADLQALPGESAGVRRCVRAGVVQADPSRHGPARALPGSGSAQGRTDLAGPAAQCRLRTHRCGRHRYVEGQGGGLGTVRVRAGRHGVGVGVDVPRRRQARRRERRAYPPGAAEGLGGQPTRSAGEGAEGTRTHPDGIQPGGR